MLPVSVDEGGFEVLIIVLILVAVGIAFMGLVIHVATREVQEKRPETLPDKDAGEFPAVIRDELKKLPISPQRVQQTAQTLSNLVDQQITKTAATFTSQWNSGTSLGFGLNGGAVLFRAGAFRLDAEAGLRSLSVPTGMARVGWYNDYTGMEASTFGVGLVARLGSVEPE